MEKCEKCKKVFKSNRNLKQHNKQNSNCLNRCFICLKYFKGKSGLYKHESIVCKQRYQCDECYVIYSSRFRLNGHLCEPETGIVKQDNMGLNKLLNIPENKNVTMNINNLIPICRNCNLGMSNRYTIQEWIDKYDSPIKKRWYFLYLY